MRRKWWILVILVALVGAGGFMLRRGFDWPGSPWAGGTQIEALGGVPVFDNGPFAAVSHGRSETPDGYAFGLKWQSDEFARRYLLKARGHRMPDTGGTAQSLFDSDTPQGALNERRGLAQYRQGGMDAPRPGDLVVFADDDGLGHVAIIASVGEDFVEVVQQNAKPARERLPLVHAGSGYRIGGARPALGWLRVPTMQALKSSIERSAT